MTTAELKALAVELGMPAYAGRQIADWLYKYKVKSIDEMTNLSLANRRRLAENCEIGCREPLRVSRSTDGTVKYLFPAGPSRPVQQCVETVFIPEGDHATLCVSSQIGCRMNCLFCQTGKQGFGGQLTAAEILNQVYSLPEVDQLTNIVFMGQGEPLDNLDSVLRATNILTDPKGWGWSPKRITISTVGLRQSLPRLLNECRCHVAVSLHAAIHDVRAMLMPAEHSMPIADIISELARADFSHQRRITFEYIVFKGINDTEAHAKALARLLQPLDAAIGSKWDSQCRVNLMHFHTIPGTDLHGADDATVIAFQEALRRYGITATIRKSRGQDIEAACGMLYTAQKKEDC